MNERAAFEAWANKHWGNSAYLHKSATCGEWDAWQAGRVDLPVLLAQVDSLRTALQRVLDARNSKTEVQARMLLLTLKRFGVGETVMSCDWGKTEGEEDLPEPEHINNETCWCEPELDYTDPDTGVSVYVHRGTQ